jgi:hypothetical protein
VAEIDQDIKLINKSNARNNGGTAIVIHKK